jgi:phenylpropionate dioxygenase-like ring-hydroxylating dioxygenase large terminal subunit
MFLRNVWYVAGFSADLRPGDRMGRRFLNEPVVLFRTGSGLLGALEDRCCHRAMPLSEGHVDGEIIRCCYHGLEFDTRGICTRVPGQDRIPPQACVRTYPVFERDAVIWLWLGDAAEADPALIPGHRWHNEAQWLWRSMYYHVAAGWELLVDNLMDLTHLAYVHARTIGGNADLHFRTQTRAVREGNKVKVTRHMPDSIAPRTYVDAAGFKGRIDRWQEVEFEPLMVRVNTGACDAGTGAYEGRRDHGFSMVVLHGVTPETDRTTHYVWSIATNAAVGHDVAETVFEQIAATIKEDQAVLEAQQRRIDDSPDGKFVDIPGDLAGNQTRRLLRALFDAENQPAAVARQEIG